MNTAVVAGIEHGGIMIALALLAAEIVFASLMLWLVASGVLSHASDEPACDVDAAWWTSDAPRN